MHPVNKTIPKQAITLKVEFIIDNKLVLTPNFKLRKLPIIK